MDLSEVQDKLAAEEFSSGSRIRPDGPARSSTIPTFRFLRSVVVAHFDDGPEVGSLPARAGADDVVGAHLVVVAARRSEPIVIGDMQDLESLTATLRERRPILMSRPS